MNPKPTYRTLLMEAIAVIEQLGYKRTAMIDARVWSKYFKRKMKKMEGKP